MAAITVKGLTLAPQTPRVIVPIIESSRPAVLAVAKGLAAMPQAELVELRLDALTGADVETQLSILGEVRTLLGDKPLLATVRTARQGGLANLTPDGYFTLVKAVCESRTADLVDIEFAAGEAAAQLLVVAHRNGAMGVLSHHNFTATPTVAEMTNLLQAMADLGGDICKLAVMPATPADVAALLQATAQAAAANPQTPLLTISMGALGAVSRVCGGAFGSVATFGMAGQASAPGQPEAAALRRALDDLAACL